MIVFQVIKILLLMRSLILVAISTTPYLRMVSLKPSLGLVLVVELVGLASRVLGQAPGDGDPLCTEETVGGVANPFFASHPVYSVNERPLMDSRDYNRLLLGGGAAYIPWQSVDGDNNNTAEIITEVKCFPFPIT